MMRPREKILLGRLLGYTSASDYWINVNVPLTGKPEKPAWVERLKKEGGLEIAMAKPPSL
jgi:hypothetical protein